MITKDNAKQWLPLVQAMAEGKTVQVCLCDGHWANVEELDLTYIPAHQYRIGPEPRWRAWKPEEAPRCFMAKYVKNGDIFVIKDGVDVFNGMNNVCWEKMKRDFLHIHEDGTEHPCGVLES